MKPLCWQGTLILGSVGSNTWRGTLNEYQKENKVILDPDMQEASYMGMLIICYFTQMIYFSRNIIE